MGFKVSAMCQVGKWKLRERLEDFLAEERGASDMVTVVVLIVIVIAVAGVFHEKLGDAIENIFGKLNDFIDTSSHNGLQGQT